MTRKPRLELTWPGKEHRERLEPRVLVEVPELSYHAGRRVGSLDRFDNLLIQGDNLLALKALEGEFAGKVKCVYIDPPYNTGSAFEHYDDGIEHSLWLSLMRDRLELLWSLLAQNGSIWISIDDNEAHYLKVLCDDLFGRANFVANLVWEKRTTRENRRVLSFNHDHILVYARSKNDFESTRNLLPLSQDVLDRYKNPDGDPRGSWQSVSANAQAGHATASQFYEFIAPSGTTHLPPEGRCWLYSRERMAQEVANNNIWFGKNGTSVPRIKKFLHHAMANDAGLTPETLWKAVDVGTNDTAKKHLLQIFDGQPRFDTPKPEELVSRIIEIASNPGDLVLDSFLGSGTTAAVAHKLGRRWIGVELGTHAVTCCVPRLRKVIDNTDPGGVTASTNWQGGGGFRFYRLAPTLLKRDAWNQLIINPDLPAEVLVQAVCKLEGYRYEPDPDRWWVHGRASERAFLYVTTQHLSAAQLLELSHLAGPDAGLVVCCAAYTPPSPLPDNLELKKLPVSLADRCEWDRDDYSLQIAQLPADAEAGKPATAADSAAAATPPKRRGRPPKPAAADPQRSLFADDEGGAE